MPQVVICYCANGLKVARLGVSVGVKHGNAVRRNRIKRVFRAAFRLSQTVLAGGVDYVLIPRLGVKEYTTKAVCEALLAAGKKLKVDAHA
jgi:ribonuclease P protein component